MNLIIKNEFRDIPNEWYLQILGDLTDIIIDGTHNTPTYTKTGIPFLRVNNLKSGEINLDEIKYISEEEHNQLRKRCNPQKGDILLSKNGTIGITKIVDWDWEFSIFVSIALIRTKPDLLHNKFLTYFLQSKYLTKQIKLQSKQGTVTNLHLEEIRRFILPLPPLPEQQKIASILSTVDEKIEAIEGQIKETEHLKKGLMQRLLTKGIGHTKFQSSPLGEIPESWEVVKIDKLLENVLDFRGKTPKKLGDKWGNGNIPALSANNVKMGYIDFNRECNLGSEKLYKKWMTKGDLEKGDVLFTMEAPLGNVAQVPDNNKYILSQRVIAFKPKKDIITNEFFKYYLSSYYFQNILEANSTGTTAKGIQQKRLVKLSIPIPPISEQQKIASILSTVDEKLENLQSKKSQYEQLKKGLMQKLLTGKIRVKVKENNA